MPSPPPTQTAYTIPATATAPSSLEKSTLPTPTPGPSQVLIRVTAVSLNFRDLLIASRSPEYPGAHAANLTPCSDGAGVIYSTHPTSRWHGKEGVRVVLHSNLWLDGDVRNLDLSKVHGGFETQGTLREFMVVGDEKIVEVGDDENGISDGQWASLITAGGTAWSALREGMDGRFDGVVEGWSGGWTEKKLKGKTVLTMGTGGVSCFAIQFAVALGATVIATSSSDEKLEIARELGATHLINYSKVEDWDVEVLRLTDGKGVDQVIEVAGAKTLLKSITSTRPGGLISLIGILTGAAKLPEEVVPAVLFGGKIVKGCVAFNKVCVDEMVKFVGENGIKPLVAKTFEFDQAIDAFHMLQKGGAVGNVVIKVA
ncbi:unnamed protein product [Periconia digitata]|uniref:Enoyl reductase (ER) domain-containing protein n=1 Tax=Periconia digitata TaxID=1303443 RepID=A0A9W4UNU6_9PLEO|nr:unnamed protein product [Periconia digitata]